VRSWANTLAMDTAAPTISIGKLLLKVNGYTKKQFNFHHDSGSGIKKLQWLFEWELDFI
jgi:hypothetical protein